jgi:hypothetical protein
MQVREAVKFAVLPTGSLDEEGETIIDDITGMMLIVAGELRIAFPFSVTFANRDTIPTTLPAVNVTDWSEVAFNVPKLLFRSQVYEAPGGQGPPVQESFAVKVAVSPTPTVLKEGDTLMEDNAGTIVIGTGALWIVVPSKLELTNIVALPTALFAANRTDRPVEEFSEPRSLVRDQE